MANRLPGTRRTTVTVGTFDGVHRGHQAVLAEIVRRARKTDRASVLVTFEPHPLTVVAPERAPAVLTSALEKRLLWPIFGLDYVQVLRFDDAMRRMSPATFVRQVLVKRLRVGELVIGYDHGFGRDRSGNVDVLRRLGEEEGFVVDVVEPVDSDDGTISSTRIRSALAEGRLEAVERALGRRYGVLGRVERGAGRGRRLGFPTANLRVDDPRKALPPDGVYAVAAEVAGARRPGVAHLGPRPTFGDVVRQLEVHLLDWDGQDLYRACVGLEFVSRIRGVRRFGGPRELTAQLILDCAAARAALAGAAFDGLA